MKKPSTTPTQRTLRLMRQKGYRSAVVEKWIDFHGEGKTLRRAADIFGVPRISKQLRHSAARREKSERGPPGVRKDLYGIGDVIGIRWERTLLVQCCAMSAFSAHVTTILTAPLPVESGCDLCKGHLEAVKEAKKAETFTEPPFPMRVSPGLRRVVEGRDKGPGIVGLACGKISGEKTHGMASEDPVVQPEGHRPGGKDQRVQVCRRRGDAMAQTIVRVTLEQVSCGVDRCGVIFGLEACYYRNVHHEGRWFYCPNGHRVRYGESEKKELEDKVARLISSNDQLRSNWLGEESRRKTVERSRARYKGEITKFKRRIARGECPLCNGKTFKGVRRHIQRKHPELLEELKGGE